MLTGGKEQSRVHIEITTRHGTLESGQQTHLHEKAQKVLKYFGRLMSIEVEVDQRKNDWLVEIFVSAEHKHDFVARETADTPETAMDQCVHKIEQQLRRYKEKIQNHKGDVPRGGTGPKAEFEPRPTGAGTPGDAES
jgi:putative sigma-54 modulation protein